MQYVFPISKSKHYRFPTHVNDLVMCRSQATASEVFIVVLEPGEAPPRHKHDDTEQIFYVLEGKGRLEISPPGSTSERSNGKAKTFPVKPGDMVRIPVSTWHRIHNESETPLRYFAVDCFPGGRPKDEPTWDVHARANCTKFGWDYAKVVGKKSKKPAKKK